LCLTYTRAAAAEMQERLFKMLGEWSLMEDAALAEALAGLGGDAPEGAEALGRARKLFAKALETPGGLKIQTIHAFCAALLRRFPLESGAPAGFAELDDRTRARSLDGLRDARAAAAEAGADPAFDAAADRLTETGLASLSDAVFHRRGWFPGAEAAAPALRAAYDVPEGWDFLAHAGRRLAETGADGLRDLAAALTAGGVTDAKLSAQIATAAAALEGGDVAAAARAVEAAGLTKDGKPRSLKTLPSKAVRAAYPWAEEAVADLVALAAELRDGRLAHDGLAKSLDLHRFGDALLARYAAEKTRRGAIDFDDLVRIAARLLTEAEMAAFALWKLDGGLDHILIDEAQDTSPEQWRLVRALAEEFFAGAGAREAGRTVFAVGDEKQSIYSFQGAEPREFGRMRDLFRDRLAAMAAAGEGPALRETQLAWSFRSSPVILRLVDAVFAEAADGLSADGRAPEHSAFHAAMPGRVELWPLLTPPETTEEPPWHAPVDAAPARAPVARLAEALARHVDAMLRDGGAVPDPKSPSGWRRMRAGDVIVLLRRRGALAKMLVDQLKRRGVPVAGADRLKLLSSLAVRDLLSLLRAALDSGDDLSVAEVLRSPLGGVDEAGLFELASGRARGVSLWSRLQARQEAFPQAPARLAAVIDDADYLRPHEILQVALVAHGGRARIRARMTPEEEDAVDELLAQALAYERAETPTLAGFLAWMEAADALELKREMGRAEGAVRVMTVHGAKGLEAPVVILGDAGPRQGGRTDEVLALPGEEDAGEVALWSAPKAEEAAPVTEAKARDAAKAAEEDLRLLYVALTRAGARLLVCGVEAARGDAA
ncbi:MAG: UvrD-helicase domain-containing protein, partial [Pseudomonadota bacterium]|nr:UvrD-helicase domain-containing protein [Pseudomonadota bacterium]